MSVVQTNNHASPPYFQKSSACKLHYLHASRTGNPPFERCQGKLGAKAKQLDHRVEENMAATIEDDALCFNNNRHESTSFQNDQHSYVATADNDVTEKTTSTTEETWNDLKRRLYLLQIYLGMEEDDEYFLRHVADANSDDDDDENGNDDDTATTASSHSRSSHSGIDSTDCGKGGKNERSCVVYIVDR